MLDRPDWKTISKETRTARLTDLMTVQGLTATDAALHFTNCTRNAILGFCHRHHVVLKKPVREPAERAGKRKLGRSSTTLETVVVRERVKAMVHEVIPEDGVHILDLKTGQCRWPLWGDGKTESAHRVCCGHGVEGEGPYCPDHSKVAFVR